MSPDEPRREEQPEPAGDRTPAKRPNAPPGRGETVTLTWSGGAWPSDGSFTYSMVGPGEPGESAGEHATLSYSAVLPPGLSLNPDSGLILGAVVWRDDPSLPPAPEQRPGDEEEPPQPFLVDAPKDGPDRG